MVDLESRLEVIDNVLQSWGMIGISVDDIGQVFGMFHFVPNIVFQITYPRTEKIFIYETLWIYLLKSSAFFLSVLQKSDSEKAKDCACCH